MNRSFSSRLIADGKQVIEVGGVTTASMLQVAGEPKLGYAAVMAPQRANADIDKFISKLHHNPKKIRELLKTQGKILNLTGKNQPYESKWKASLAEKGIQRVRKLGLAGGGKGKWGLKGRMGPLTQQVFDENVLPDFWAAPYLTILYPSIQMNVR